MFCCSLLSFWQPCLTTRATKRSRKPVSFKHTHLPAHMQAFVLCICIAFIAASARLKGANVHVPPCLCSCQKPSITPTTAASQAYMLNAIAGRLTHLQASVGSTLSVLALLYAFWYLGKAWPAVATAGGGFFSMQQAISRLSNSDELVIMQVDTIFCLMPLDCTCFWFLVVFGSRLLTWPHLQCMS